MGTSWHGYELTWVRVDQYSFHRCYKSACDSREEMKWNESGFRPPLCTYRLNWARRTSWGWWDDWDDTVLQTQDSKFEPWRSEAEYATSRSRRLPTILTFTRGWGRNNFCFFQTAETGNRTPDSGVKGSGANHYPRAPAHSREDNNYLLGGGYDGDGVVVWCGGGDCNWVDAGADPAFQRVGGGCKIWHKKYFTVKESRGQPPGEFLFSKSFVMQSKAYWAVFLTQYVTKSKGNPQIRWIFFLRGWGFNPPKHPPQLEVNDN